MRRRFDDGAFPWKPLAVLAGRVVAFGTGAVVSYAVSTRLYQWLMWLIPSSLG